MQAIVEVSACRAWVRPAVGEAGAVGKDPADGRLQSTIMPLSNRLNDSSNPKLKMRVSPKHDCMSNPAIDQYFQWFIQSDMPDELGFRDGFD